MFKKGQKVVKLLSMPGAETASVVTIASVKKGVARCEGDEHLKYNAETGSELEPAMGALGIVSRLVFLEE